MLGVVRAHHAHHLQVERLAGADDPAQALHGRAHGAKRLARQPGRGPRRAGRGGVRGGGLRARRVDGPALVSVERRERDVALEVAHDRRDLIRERRRHGRGVPPEQRRPELPALALHLNREPAEQLDVRADVLQVRAGHGVEALEHREGYRAQLLDGDVPEGRVQQRQERALLHRAALDAREQRFRGVVQDGAVHLRAGHAQLAEEPEQRLRLRGVLHPAHLLHAPDGLAHVLGGGERLRHEIPAFAAHQRAVRRAGGLPERLDVVAVVVHVRVRGVDASPAAAVGGVARALHGTPRGAHRARARSSASEFAKRRVLLRIPRNLFFSETRHFPARRHGEPRRGHHPPVRRVRQLDRRALLELPGTTRARTPPCGRSVSLRVSSSHSCCRHARSRHRALDHRRVRSHSLLPPPPNRTRRLVG